LNETTDEKTHFFGIELQVVRIGDSVSAPLFKVAAKPNDWQKQVEEDRHSEFVDWFVGAGTRLRACLSVPARQAA
jgi:hypothetical protein